MTTLPTEVQGNILSGTFENDTMYGSIANDFMLGLQGNDFMNGGPGLDRLGGDEGDDTLCGGKDDDLFLGDPGNDVMYGGEGSDVFLRGDGDDTLYGGKGDDYLSGGLGNDLLCGDAGGDVLSGVSLTATNPGFGEIDTLIGGAGPDVFILGIESKSYYLGSGEADFALLADFTVGQDVIGLHGSDQFEIIDLTLDEFGSGAGIVVTTGGQNDLIGFVPGRTANELDLNRDFLKLTP